ncbi:MAG: serine hydrolase [Acidobacteria bacterium]|nr:serine hydrolase [Acidobacteriota bacterium]
MTLFFLLLSALPLLADSRSEAVDRLFTPYDKPNSPGCAVGVIQDGQFLYKRGYGLANLEYSVPLKTQSVTYIASTSKQFTAMSILLLAAQGKLALDDPVRKYVPELPAYADPVTLRQLIHHSSGLRDYFGVAELAGRLNDVWTNGAMLELLGLQRQLNFPVGTEHNYSNSGYVLLSMVVKSASGKTLRHFAQESIFQPLGMKDTHFHDDRNEIIRNRAAGYTPTRGSFRAFNSTLDVVGDGGLYTTVEDLLPWDRNFYDARVGGRALLDQMQTPGVLANGEQLDYAYGLGIDTYRGLKTVSHGGSLGGYRTEMVRFPEQRFTAICLCNHGGAGAARLALQIAEVYLGGRMARPAEPAFVALSPEQMARWIGAWQDPKTGAILRMSAADGHLSASRQGENFQLRPVAASKCFIVSEGAPVQVILEGEEMRWGRNRYVRVQLATPTLESYTGEYSTEELPARWRMLPEGGKLVLLKGNSWRLPLEPGAADQFLVGPWILTFYRNPEGHVAGFLISSGRVRNLRFEKTGLASATRQTNDPPR